MDNDEQDEPTRPDPTRADPTTAAAVPPGAIPDPSVTVRLDQLPPIPPPAPHDPTAPLAGDQLRGALGPSSGGQGGPGPGAVAPPSWAAPDPSAPPPAAGLPGWASGAPGPGANAPLEPTPVKRRRLLPILGVVVGLAVIAGGAVFAVGALGGDEKANTPQEAIQSLLDAVANEDVLGVIEAMAPGERDVLLDSFVPMVDQLKRLEILDPELDLNKVEGLDARFSRLRYETEELRDDLAAVTVTGGTVFGRVDPKRLPLGEFVRDLAGDGLADAEPEETSGDASDGDTTLVTVKDGKRWYFSLGYTIAEAARGDGFEVPEAADGVPARGAASPQEAAGDMMRALAGLDVRRVIELLPPDEMAALHDYAGQFIEEAESLVEDVRSQYRLSLPVLEFTTEKRGRVTLVKLKDLTANLRFQADDGTSLEARYADRCIRVTVDGETKRRCGQDVVKLVEDFGGPEVSIPDDQTVAGRQGQSAPDLGIAAIERDGRWYVSPLRSGMDVFTATLKVVTRKDLDDVRDQIQGLIDDTSGLDSDFDLDTGDISGSDSGDSDAQATDADTIPDVTIPG